jgi:sugar phosphate isomerase/epimerase
MAERRRRRGSRAGLRPLDIIMMSWLAHEEFKYYNKVEVRRSVVLSAFFPSSVGSEQAQSACMELVARDTPTIDTFEHYFDGGYSKRIARVLEATGRRSIYLAAVKLKRDRLDLASTTAAHRQRAVEEVKRIIDAARGYASDAVLVNTGFRPEKEEDRGPALHALAESLETLLEYAQKGGHQLDISMETGAMNQHNYELIGSTPVALDLAARLRRAHPNFSLTMDTSHLLQLREDPLESIELAASFTSHVHLANCVIRDTGSAMYGDKHPEFGAEGGELSSEQIASICGKIQRACAPRDVLFGLEIICRQPDEEAWYKEAAGRWGWFL